VWDAYGNLIATIDFTKTETSAAGWQTGSQWVANLPRSIPISAWTTYVVSVGMNTYFPYTQSGLASTISHGPLGSVSGSNGVYGYKGSFPTSSWSNSNYFVDVEFTPSTNHGDAALYGRGGYSGTFDPNAYSASFAFGDDPGANWRQQYGASYDCSNSGNCAGSNGGVNVQFLLNSCGFRPDFIADETGGFFAGVHVIFGGMPTQHYIQRHMNGSSPDPSDPLTFGFYTDHAGDPAGNYMGYTGYWMANNPGGSIGEAFTTPNPLGNPNGTGPNAIQGEYIQAQAVPIGPNPWNDQPGYLSGFAEGCNVAMSSDYDWGSAYDHLELETVSESQKEAKDASGNGSGVLWTATCQDLSILNHF
jgi:hypothetical protein